MFVLNRKYGVWIKSKKNKHEKTEVLNVGSNQTDNYPIWSASSQESLDTKFSNHPSKPPVIRG